MGGRRWIRQKWVLQQAHLEETKIHTTPQCNGWGIQWSQCFVPMPPHWPPSNVTVVDYNDNDDFMPMPPRCPPLVWQMRTTMTTMILCQCPLDVHPQMWQLMTTMMKMVLCQCPLVVHHHHRSSDFKGGRGGGFTWWCDVGVVVSACVRGLRGRAVGIRGKSARWG